MGKLKNSELQRLSELSLSYFWANEVTNQYTAKSSLWKSYLVKCLRTHTKMYSPATKVVFHLENTAFRLSASRGKYLQKKILSSPSNLQTSSLPIFYTWLCKTLHKALKTANIIMSRSSSALGSSHAHQPVLSLHCLLCQQEPSSVQGLKEEGLLYRQKLGKLSSHNQSWSVNILYYLIPLRGKSKSKLS